VAAPAPANFMDQAIHWIAPPPRLELDHRTVHVWRAELHLPADRFAALRRTLAPAEIDRANRFRFEPDRMRFVAARGILRRLLSKYQNCPETDLEIHTNAFGKPFVDGEVSFNLSHSSSLAVFAFAKNIDIGIDIERIRADVEYLDIARRYFTAAELGNLEATAKERQIEVFFRAWTRKEALLKALGKGLAESPASGETSPADSKKGASWKTESFVPQGNFVGSIVFGADDPRLDWWEFSF
jgi:4'-phosphopantetheinyl transferase